MTPKGKSQISLQRKERVEMKVGTEEKEEVSKERKVQP